MLGNIQFLGVCTIIALLLVTPPTYGRDGFLAPHQIDLTEFLAPPPRPMSQDDKADIAAVVAAQRDSSRERTQQAILDDKTTLAFFVGDRLGPSFNREHMPSLFALLDEVAREGNMISEDAKRKWNRPRPFRVDSAIRSLVGTPKNASYPSGHTIFAYEMAIILSEVAPEARDALFARAAEFGRSRVIVGVHYPSDVVAGEIAATAIVVALMQSPAFKSELIQASAEFAAAQALPAAVH